MAPNLMQFLTADATNNGVGTGVFGNKQAAVQSCVGVDEELVNGGNGFAPSFAR
jgi:hypothetical protein